MAYKISKRKNIDPMEPSCEKTIYYSLKEAQDMVSYIKETRNVREISAYKCMMCGFWHLTSRAKS